MIILTLKLTLLTIPTQLILDDLRKQGLQKTLEKMKEEKTLSRSSKLMVSSNEVLSNKYDRFTILLQNNN